jgi:aminopeptidase N
LARNLTRDEAQDRARLLDVGSYQIELDLTGGESSFGSVTTVRFGCTRPGSSAFIDLTALEVCEIMLNGDQVPVSAFSGTRITLPGLAAQNDLRVTAQCAYSRTGEGLHRFADPADGRVYLYSDLQTFDANRVFPCFDQPDLKATYEFTVLAPADWRVLSNEAPDVTGEPAGSHRRWHFPPTPVLSTYITAIAAGPYHAITTSHDGIPMGLYCRESLAPFLDAEEIFTVTRQGFDFYHAAFGVRYPFGKYDQLFAPEYKAGAMENAGLVTILEDYVFRSRVTDARRERRAETILHELAHMWFGDLVTMRWWDDLWLNESFATWASFLCQAEVTRWGNAWTTFAQTEKALAYKQDQLSTTHPVACDIPDIGAVEVNFDAITYEKGASVLKQLVAWVGRDQFLDGLRGYFGQHAWGNATLGDLLDALERSSGRDLSTWSKAWLETAGVNTLRPQAVIGADRRWDSFAVLQSATAGQPVLRPHRIAIGLYDRGPDGLRRRLRVETDITGSRTEIAELAGVAVPDLVLINDDDLSYAKVRLDEASLRTLLDGIGDFAEQLPAALCWAAAWDMCRDGELAARDYVGLVASAVGSVPEIYVTQTLLNQAAAAARSLADPGWRATGLSQLAGSLRELMRAAEPGSDQQLGYVHAFAGVAAHPGDLELLNALLTGDTVLDGLTVDTGLRWHLLLRLVSRGVAGRDAIMAEQAADATDEGARQAATCLAAIPEPEAKQRAWDQITSGQLTNATFRATLIGFAQPDQGELLVPYRERYFDEVPGLWRDWGFDMAQYFAKRAYPSWSVSPATVQAAEGFLAVGGAPGPLRRLVAEGLDETARALRCQERDRQAAG